MRFGFNDLGGDLTPLLSDYQPAALVAFDGGRAQMLASAFPEATIIYRHMPDGDNLHARRPDAAAWYREARAACGNNNRIVIQCGNEPDVRSPAELAALSAWTNTCIDAANADGGTVAVLAYSACHPDARDWSAQLLPVLRKLSGSRHMLAIHEYFLNNGQPYCIGHFRDCFQACDRAQIARPNMILTEYGFDLPGWKVTQRERGLLDETYAAQLVRAWNEIYAPAGVSAACIFCWGSFGGWQDYDVSGAGAFLTALKAAKLSNPAKRQAEPTSVATTTEPPSSAGNDDHGALEARIAALEAKLDRVIAANEQVRCTTAELLVRLAEALKEV